MKEKGKLFFKKNIKRTWIIIILVLLVVSYLIFKPSSSVKNTITDMVIFSDLKETILATGQVVSNTDLNLSFNISGVVESVKVKIGDQVKKGQILATLDQASALATLTQARGALAAANARYKRVLEGATNEEIRLSQITLDQTKNTQETLINNAYQDLLNSTPEATPKDEDDDYTAPIISGTYKLGKEGQIIVETYNSSGGTSYNLSGLTTGTGLVNTITPQPLGNSGLYITFPADASSTSTDWIIEIPNKKAADYLLNYNNYQATVAQAKSLIDQREAELAITKANARPSDIDLAQADIISAQGQVEQAQARYSDTLIKAPADGTITSVDIKPGELASALKEVLILQDVSNIYLEANINEANIDSLAVGMTVDITYDAFGSEKIFKGNLTKIDPSSTVISGVVNYKITTSVEQIDSLRPGMTANMTILAKEKNNILTIPERSIVIKENGDRFIRIITNTKKKKFKEVPIITGMKGDGGLVEVISGLQNGDEYVVLVKSK